MCVFDPIEVKGFPILAYSVMCLLKARFLIVFLNCALVSIFRMLGQYMSLLFPFLTKGCEIELN